MPTLDIEKVKKNLVSDEILEILKRGRIKAHSGLASPLSSQASCLNLKGLFVLVLQVWKARYQDLKRF